MTNNTYLNQIIFENFTIDQRNKLEVLLEKDDSKLETMKKFFNKIMEPIKSKINSIVNPHKIDDYVIDSKGDINKVKHINYPNAVLKLLTDVKGRNEISTVGKDIKLFYEYIEKHTKHWKKAYVQMMNGSEGGYLLYSTYNMHVDIYVEAVALLLICYLHNTNPKKFDFFELIFYYALNDYKKNNVISFCNALITDKKDKIVKEELTVVATSMIVIGVVIAFAFALRMLVFYFYYSRTQLSDYFEQQATFLKIHATEVKNRKDLSAEEKKAILESQKKWAERLTTLSELISVDSITAMKKAKEEINIVNKDINPQTVDIDNNNDKIDFF